MNSRALAYALMPMIVISAIAGLYFSQGHGSLTSDTNIAAGSTVTSLGTTGGSSGPATSASSICTFPGQSMGLFLRVISDSTSSPIAGAIVNATYSFSTNCGSDSTSSIQQKEDITLQSFLTNNTRWYSLQGLNDGNYSLVVAYSSQDYNLSAQLTPSTYTCATLYLPSGRSNVTTSATPCSPSQLRDQISLSGGISLCPSNCGYPSPYLSGTILVNGAVPLKSLQLFINGTFELTTTYTNNFTQYAIGYKAIPSNASMSIVSGKTYVILFVATFEDGNESNATAVVVATNSGDTVTVTEEIIQQSIYTQRACTEQLGITNTTTFITPSVTASQTYVTITTTQFFNSTWTTTISPPPVITTIINGTTIFQSCG